ncbi:unnamed protein product [Calypogeia fissa]
MASSLRAMEIFGKSTFLGGGRIPVIGHQQHLRESVASHPKDGVLVANGRVRGLGLGFIAAASATESSDRVKFSNKRNENSGSSKQQKQKQKEQEISSFRGPRRSSWGEIEPEEAPVKPRREDSDPDFTDSESDVTPVKESPGERLLNRALHTRSRNSLEPQRVLKDDLVEFKGDSNDISTSRGAKFGEMMPKKKKKDTAPKVNLLHHSQPSCYGCGSILQTSEAEAPGYIAPETFAVKKKHHQLKTVLCGRCRLLSQGQMIPAVGGVGGYGEGKGYIPAEQLRTQLSHLRHEKALVVKLVDIVDFNGSFLNRVRDLVGANPIVLVLTKVDLLPLKTDLGALGDWLQEAIVRKKLNVISIHLTSSKAKTGISRVAADISRQRLGRDVYILGSANVGKSAFVTALLQDMARRDFNASAALRFKPIQSAMPGTTLGPIEFEAFPGGGKLYDTPGVHLHHRMAAALDPQDVSLLAPRRRLRGYVIGPAEAEEEEPEEESLFDDIDLDAFLKEKSGGKDWSHENSFTDIGEDEQDGTWTEGVLGGYSLFWGGIARIDVIKAPKDLKFTFYGPTAIRVLRVPTEEADEFYQDNIGRKLTPPSSSAVGQWAGLEKVQEISLIAEKLSKKPAGDVAISGLGWFTIGKANVIEDDVAEDDDGTIASATAGDEDSQDLYNEDEEILIVLHIPKTVEMFVRPSIPLGKKATKWYEYVDLSDAELAARPQVFY